MIEYSLTFQCTCIDIEGYLMRDMCIYRIDCMEETKYSVGG
jgi:hypothetical protein